MLRPLALIVLAVAAAVVLLVGGARVLARDRAALRAGYAEDRLRAVEQAAATLARDVEEIGEDLELAATLLSQTSQLDVRERELHAIATIEKPYLAAELRDVHGSTLARVVAPDAPNDVLARAAAGLEETIRQTYAHPGRFQTSRPLGEPTEDASWYRVFARSSPRNDGLVVALVVDMRPLLARLQLLEGTSSSLLVIGAHGQPAPASNPALAARVRALDPAASPGLARLMAFVRAKQTGSIVLTAREVRGLALPDAPAVAVTSPVLIEDGEAWALALVSSTAALSGQERTLLRRLLVGAGTALTILVALSIYFVRNGRRAAALNERLRQADRIASLRRVEERVLHAEKMVTAGQLAAGIAHELGTPLNVIRARAELAIDRLGEHPEVRGQRIVLDQVDHVSRLIAQLLDYVRPAPQAVRAVPIAPALAGAVELLAVEAEQRGVSLACEVAGEPPPVRADPGQLQQVLVNLIMNALDACARGGAVVVRAAPGAGATVTIEVQDDGTGIDPAVRAQIFDPFYTTKKRGQGTGLGLWVVSQLVRAHDGEIDLDSTPGAGTLVRITWPSADRRTPGSPVAS